MEPVPWEMLRTLSPWALVSLAVVSLIRGWLIPRATVQLLTQRAEDWRAAWERTEQARAIQAEQLAELLQYARTADAVLRSLPHAPVREPA